MIRFIATSAAWLICSLLSAAQPKSVITGPTSAGAPGFIILSSTGSVWDMYTPEWTVGDDSVGLMEDTANGRLGLFYSGNTPLTTKVWLTTYGANSAVDGWPFKSTVSWPITFGGTPPTPPGPSPGPTPVPPGPVPGPVVLPDGRYKLAALSYNAAMQVPLPARGDAVKIASAFTAAAAANANNQAADQASLANAGALLKAGIAAAEGADAQAWSAWQAVIYGVSTGTTGINGLHATGDLVSLNDFSIACAEIAQGTGQAK